MSVLSQLFRKNIYREIPVTSSFWQQVLADFQILVKCLSGNSHRTKVSHCADANTNHLLSPTKASLVKQRARLTAESQEASTARHRWAHLLSKHLDGLSEIASGTAQDVQGSHNCSFFSPAGESPFLGSNWYYVITSDPMLPQIIVGETKLAVPITASIACTPSLHLLRKGSVSESNEEQHVSQLWQQFPLFHLKNISVFTQRQGCRSEPTAVSLFSFH